jgi:hypothetical protein
MNKCTSRSPPNKTSFYAENGFRISLFICMLVPAGTGAYYRRLTKIYQRQSISTDSVFFVLLSKNKSKRTLIKARADTHITGYSRQIGEDFGVARQHPRAT